MALTCMYGGMEAGSSVGFSVGKHVEGEDQQKTSTKFKQDERSSKKYKSMCCYDNSL